MQCMAWSWLIDLRKGTLRDMAGAVVCAYDDIKEDVLRYQNSSKFDSISVSIRQDGEGKIQVMLCFPCSLRMEQNKRNDSLILLSQLLLTQSLS